MHVCTELLFCQAVAQAAIVAAIFNNCQWKKASRCSPSSIIVIFHTTGLLSLPQSEIKAFFFFFFFLKFFCVGGSPPPPPIAPRPHFVCKFSRHGSSSPVTSHLAPSITVLVFPDSADAYSRTTASYRLTQCFRPNTRE
jgi:hypothetical protein